MKNGKDITLDLSAGALPNVSGALRNWQQTISIFKITEEIVDFRVVETETQVDFKGVMQPMGPQELFYKPEGQRDWKWHTLHTEINIELIVDEKVKHKGITYRVMKKWPFDSYGYYKYDLIEDDNVARGVNT